VSEEPEINPDAGDYSPRPAISMPLMVPKSAEEAMPLLMRYFPLIDWRNLAIVRLKTTDGQELLALPAPIMEQLLTAVVGLCAVLSHDGPAH
jgi:hypothetical protein